MPGLETASALTSGELSSDLVYSRRTCFSHCTLSLSLANYAPQFSVVSWTTRKQNNSSLLDNRICAYLQCRVLIVSWCSWSPIPGATVEPDNSRVSFAQPRSLPLHLLLVTWKIQLPPGRHRPMSAICVCSVHLSCADGLPFALCKRLPRQHHAGFSLKKHLPE